jgi:quercetin dioxygenase-like cupin family protein
MSSIQSGSLHAVWLAGGSTMTGSVLEATQAKVLEASAMQWAPHPKFKGVEITYLLSKKEDGIDMTCVLVRWHVGAEIPKHIHEESDDILYIIQGKAKIWIDQLGDIPVSAGSFVRIPKGVLHQPHDVEEELIAHDTWFPATV